MATVEWVLPFADSDITCKHGVVDKLHPNGHRGTDYGRGKARAGAPIGAVSHGRVAVSEWHKNLGNVVVMRHATGKFSYYCHLQEPGLPVGSYVAKAGDVIGKVGNTGAYSFGSHLHCGISDGPRGFISGAVHDIVKYVKEQQAANKKAAEKPAAAPVEVPEVVEAAAPVEVPEVVEGAVAAKAAPKKAPTKKA